MDLLLAFEAFTHKNTVLDCNSQALEVARTLRFYLTELLLTFELIQQNSENKLRN